VPANGVFANQDGKVDERLYVVGWAKRGPSGTIPTNRVEAQQLAQRIAQEMQSGERPGGAGLRKLLEATKRALGGLRQAGGESMRRNWRGPAPGVAAKNSVARTRCWRQP
jgi:hypothetical protein